jgi:hypothetical protein
MNIKQLLERTEETVDELNDEVERQIKSGLPIGVNLAAARAYAERLLACLKDVEKKERKS